jgi:GNAT superfamily N-acetyltransferase
MERARSELRSGLEYLEAVTALLRRIRCTHPTAGLYEAAEIQWWWAQTSRWTDSLGQLFWFDEQGLPLAAVIATAFKETTQLDPIVMPDATPEWIVHVMDRGLAHAGEAGIGSVVLELDSLDEVLQPFLVGRGFTIEKSGGLVETWMTAGDRPSVSPLADGYTLSRRVDVVGRSHHMANDSRNHGDPEARLQQTSLYRSDLDLVVYDDHHVAAAYGLFWYDPVTRVGVAEPMRTEDDHQRRGLARHVLTSGIDRLVAAGAERIKICFEPRNPASKHLYLSTGFEPARFNDMASGPTGAHGADPLTTR